MYKEGIRLALDEETLQLVAVFQHLFIVCPSSWINLQGSCYKFSSKALNWNAAKSACETLGSNLVVINSQTELQALTSKESQKTWIGLHRDRKDKSRWLWVDASRPTYSHWNTGEPNNLHEECAEMYPKIHGWKWNDQSCSDACLHVCETRGMSGCAIRVLTLVYIPSCFKL